jgi:hypothetical protein
MLQYVILSLGLGWIIWNTIILSVLYWHETWPFTLGQEHTLRVFKSKILRIIVGLKREEIIGRWRNLHMRQR